MVSESIMRPIGDRNSASACNCAGVFPADGATGCNLTLKPSALNSSTLAGNLATRARKSAGDICIIYSKIASWYPLPMIAALFVEKNGVYSGHPSVDTWDKTRDARLYSGPHRVIAHPPCERWGNFWHGACAAHGANQLLGNDDGCFASALSSARVHGGVIEHPANSRAWEWFGLPRPGRGGGWSGSQNEGWSCQIEQGNYGHRGRKATWLYFVGPKPHELKWGPSTATVKVENMGKAERQRTPVEFRDLLISLVSP